MLVEVNGKEVRLPDFFIVGAAKSGTTSLARYLDEHPEIYISPIKEPQFFAFYGREYVNNKPEPFSYVKNFDEYVNLFNGASDKQILGEASTWYSIPVTVDNTINNIIRFYRDKAKELKFIFIIRNPIERIFSAYLMYVNFGLENLPFEEALSIASERIKKGYRLEFNYIENMMISSPLKKYISTFSRTNIRIYLYEDLKERPIWLLQNIFSFLGVDSEFVPKNINKIYNKSGVYKSYFHKLLYNVIIKYNPLKPVVKKALSDKTKMEILEKAKNIFYTKPELSWKTKDELKKIFRNDILELQEIIERDLSHWLE